MRKRASAPESGACRAAIGRVHGRRLLLRWLAKRAGKWQKYNPKKRFVNPQPRQAQYRLGAGHGLPPVLPFGSCASQDCQSLA